MIFIKTYNKLVRDKIPEIMINNGAKPITRILDDEEYKKELDKKLQEEVSEYLNNDDVLELADIQEVILAILNFKNIKIDEFENLRKQKAHKRGAFNDKIFLEKEQ